MTKFNPIITILVFTLFGCSQEPPIVNVDVTVPTPEVVIIEESPEDTDEPTDTGEPEPVDDDPCDLTFRTYAEDGHYVDVVVGAMPLVQAVGGTESVSIGTPMPTGIFEISSKQGCGEIDILGVQVLIERLDGANLTKVDTPDNELIDTNHNISTFTSTGWYGASFDSPTAPTIGMDWSSVWSSTEIGDFSSYTLGPNDSNSYIVRANALEVVPAGEYVLTFALSWRDVETGTEVWAADIDHADWHIILF